MKEVPRSMKRFLIVLLTLALCMGCCGAFAEEEKVLRIYSWEDYVDADTIAGFSEEYGIDVEFITFASNEEMLLKLEQGGGENYDIIVASDYVISSARKKDLLMPLDKDKLANFGNLNPNYLNQYFDPDNVYSIPYTVGSPMIVYDPDRVEGDIRYFADLWDPQFADSLCLLDDARVMIGETLKMLGYSYNTTDDAQLQEASDKLMGLKPNVRALDYDTAYQYLLSGEVSAAYLFTNFAVDLPDGEPQSGGGLSRGGRGLRRGFPGDSHRRAASGQCSPVPGLRDASGSGRAYRRIPAVYQSQPGRRGLYRPGPEGLRRLQYSGRQDRHGRIRAGRGGI